MASDKKRKRRTQELEEARARHAELLAKVEKARAKLEKRAGKLHTLELRIAELEQSLYDPEQARLGQAGNDKTLRDAFLIYNPKSVNNGGEDHQLNTVVELLRAHGIRAEVGIKTSGKAVRQMAKDAADKGGLIIVGGGDGTIEEVASQIIGKDVTLGILPLGTMNNIARSLGIPLEVDAACGLLGMGVTRKIDLGHVIADEKPEVEYFMETAGLGLSAIAFPMGQAAKKHAWGELPKAVRKLFEVKPAPIAVELDNGEVVQAHSQLVTVSNAPMIGTNIMIAPTAKMDDGLLDLALFDNMTKSDLMGYFMNSKNAANDERIKRYRVKRVKIRASEPEPVASDKDPIPARHEMEIEVVPQALNVIVGNGSALSLPVQAMPVSTQEGGKDAAEPVPAAAQPVVVGEISSQPNGASKN